MKTNIFYIAIAAMMLVGCTGNNDKEANEAEDAEVEMADVTLTDSQVKKLGISFGALPTHEFSGEIEANGSLAVAPQSQASVSP